MTEKIEKKGAGEDPAGRPPAKTKKMYDVFVYHDWCKACGICIAFCPLEILQADKSGKAVVIDQDRCTGCRFCEIHCPDFAITVIRRKPKRRRNDV